MNIAMQILPFLILALIAYVYLQKPINGAAEGMRAKIEDAARRRKKKRLISVGVKAEDMDAQMGELLKPKGR